MILLADVFKDPRGALAKGSASCRIDWLKAELEAQIANCLVLEGPQLFRAQGLAQGLQELIASLEHGTEARTPEVRTTCVT